MIVCALGALAALSAASLPPAAESAPDRSARGLAARMVEQAHAACLPARGGTPECIRPRPDEEPDDDIGRHSVLAPIDPADMPAACFDAKQPPSWEIQQMVNAAIGALFNDRYQLDSRWSGASGTPRALTWSFVPDGLSIPSGIGEPVGNSNLFAQMDAKFGGIANRAVWIAQFEDCFNRWAALCGTSYTRITVGGNPWDDGAAWGSAGAAGARGDIRISMKNIDGGGNVLAYNFFPTTGTSPGDMVLDSSETWQAGGPSYLFFRNTLMHEHGHGLGIRHVCPIANTKLMEPFLSTAFDGPQQDDLRAAQRHYGDFYESNNSFATATPIGAASVGTTLNPSAVPAPGILNGSRTSIQGDGDVDWFSFTVATPIIGTITVQPVGSTYVDAPQSGSCNETSPSTNAAAQANLVLEFLDATGTTLIASANATGAGSAESLGGLLLSPPGTLIVRVSEAGTPSQTQLYTLTVTGSSTPTITASDGTFTDRVQLDWTAVTGATSYNLFRNTSNNRATASALTSVATNSHGDTTAVPGTTYFYWVEAVAGGGLSRPLAGADSGFRGVTAPANDNCASAIDVTDGSSTAGTLTGATNDAAGTCGSSATNPDVWYRFTAPACDGTLIVDTCGSNDNGGPNSNIDTVVSLYSTCGGTALACNDDNIGQCGPLDVVVLRDSYLTRAMAAGEVVLIRVSRFGTSVGVNFTLRVDYTYANDNCAAAATIASLAPTTFCNIAANTDGPAENPACLFFSDSNINGDLWYRWTAVTNGRFTASLCTNGFDTKLGIYPNSCPGAPGTILACNDDACGTGGLGSRASALGVAGTSYLIRVGGYAGNRGTATLVIHCAADVNLSGAVSVQDIFDFMEYYFSNNALADINGSGAISVQDIFDFLEYYFQGC